MDLMRSTIKSLLYDFPQDILAEYLAGEDQRMLGEGEGPQDGRRFYDLIGELMAWREKGFSSTETGLLNDVLRGDWLADAECGMSEDSSYHPYERLFLLLQKCGSELLDLTGKDPKVKFENLLRWRELTLLMGEDNLILPVVARHDVINRVGRDVFLWPNTLDHNEVKLNAILDETLSDTHFHLNAGCDVFEFNWLIAMNHPEVLDKIKEDFMGSGKMRAYDRVNRYKGVNLKLKDWVKLAGILRVMLMEAISEDDADILIGTDFGLLAEGTLPGTGRSQALMDKYRGSALRTSNGYIFDYAIRTTDTSCLSQEDISNVYMVHYGERRLIYTFLKYYFSNHEKWRRAAPVVYLYLLIKNKMRRELIQNNDLRGFENFQIYQNFKDVFFHRKNSARKTGEKEEKRSEGPDLIGEIAYRYSVQSALGPGQNHYLEARVAPGSLRKYSKMDFRTSIFGSVKVIKEENKSPVSLVAHFIKSRDTTSLSGMRSLRHGDYRERIWKKDFKHLMRSLEVVDNGNSPALTGIDAASCELGCRPEVLAPFFRSARSGGIRNVTYHVGEDFYDVVDGLRAIDEALEFLEMRNGDRLGHAIAMGVDVRKYYSWRHRYLIIPMQELLDNVVWMKFRAMELNVSLHPSTMLFIMDCYTSLTEELGYGTSLSDALYWQGMKMRGENPIGREIPAERQGKMVERLLDTYWNQVSTRKSGERTKSIRVPSSYVEDVIKLQEGMLGKVESKGVFIETNPTSNMRIGGFERYTDLPLFRFHSPGEGGWKLPVSINTDDKGVFATSLRNEYSLIAAAMWKEKDAQGDRRWNDREIMDYLKRIADYGNMSRFR